MAENLICFRCKRPIEEGSSCRGDGDGGGRDFSHPHCYLVAHPPRKARTILDVLHGGDDPPAARQILHRYLSTRPGMARNIIREFNESVEESYRRHLRAQREA